MVCICPEAVGGYQVCVELGPVVIVKQPACIVMTYPPLAPEFGFIFNPLSFIQAVPVFGFGIVDPVVKAMPQAICRMLGHSATPVG